MKVTVARDVPADVPGNYSGRDVRAGEEFYVFTAETYGSCDTYNGIALSEQGERTYPFFEFPRDALDLP
jgi:hypothetical protein